MKAVVIAAFVLLFSSLQIAHAQDDKATYLVTFQSTWSQQTHPHPAGAEQFPTNAHFSPFVGAVHNEEVTFWAPSSLASPGIENMAERGGTLLLRDEIEVAGSDVYGIITGPALSSSPGTVVINAVTATREYPLVTLVSMLAPSPDWFVGVADFSLLDSSLQWQDEIVVVLYPWDAGSDDGVDYLSADAEPASHHPITNMRGQMPFSDAPIGTLTFTLQRQVYLPQVRHQD
jgi:hypothetical protein